MIRIKSKPDLILDYSNFKKLKGEYYSGVYVHYYYNVPLYVGASIYIHARATRVYTNNMHGDSKFRRKIYKAIGLNKINIHIYSYPKNELIEAEEYYYYKLNPLTQQDMVYRKY